MTRILKTNLVLRVSCCLLFAVLARTQATAQDATHGRVDLVAESTGVSLENGMWLAASDSFIERRNWLPLAEQRASYFAEFAVDYFAAAPSVLMFTATGDTRVRVELGGPVER